MIKIKNILTLLFSILLSTCYSQNYAEKSYYLIDSLDLATLSKGDSILIDTCLRNYNTAKDDTSKINWVNKIVEDCYDDKVWPKYNHWNQTFVKRRLQGKTINPSDKRWFLKAYATCVNNRGYLYDMRGDYENALKYYKESLTLNKKANNDNGMGTNLLNIGAIFRVQGESSKALDIFNESLLLLTKGGDKSLISSALFNIGGVHHKQGRVEEAIKFYSESIKIREEINDRPGIAVSLNNLGHLFARQDNLTAALSYFKRSLEIYREINNTHGIAMSLSNIGTMSLNNRDSIQALKYYQESLILRTDINDEQGVASCLSNIGVIYFGKRDFNQALNHYIKSKLIYEKSKNMGGLADILIKIAKVYHKKGDLVKAESIGVKSLEIGQKIGYISKIKKAAKFLSKTYEKQNNGMKALEMHKLYIQMSDSINNVETQKATIKQATKYEYEKKKVIDDKENEKKIAVEKEKQKRQFAVLVVVIIAAALVIILLFVIYRRLRITRKQKLVIEEQKEEVETQRDQIEGQKNLIEEKHDEIQESIAYAKRIQEAILPPTSLLNQYLSNNFVYYQPKDIVAGDFYWLEAHDELVFFAAADCTGHGVPGAMVSVVCHNALNRAVREFGLRDTGKILDMVRELVLITFEKSEEQMKDGMDICLCAWNKSKNSLQFSGANNPLYLIKNNKLETIKGTKQPIGHVDKIVPFEAHTIDLKDIHSIYLTTDGYADQFGGSKNKKFSYKQLRELLVENHSKPTEEQNSILKDKLNNWIEQGDDEQIDDICMIGVKI